MTQAFCVSAPQYEVCLIPHVCNHITCLVSEHILLQTRLVVLFPPFFLVKLPERAGCFTEKIKDIVLNTEQTSVTPSLLPTGLINNLVEQNCNMDITFSLSSFKQVPSETNGSNFRD